MTHPSLGRQEHRPWPIPAGSWRWEQSWHHLLFAHWPVPTQVLRPLVPEALGIDEHDGTAWIGVIPFLLEIRARGAPPLPHISSFPEINVRTYVTHRGRPGVWFMSLDAENPLAVWTAQRLFHLPYYRASFRVQVSPGKIQYSSKRLAGTEVLPEFGGIYGPRSDVFEPAEVFEPSPGSLEHFLTERYCLYAADSSGGIHTTDIHHAPWSLYEAWAEIQVNSMTAPLDIELPDQEPLLHYSERIDVVTWNSRRV